MLVEFAEILVKNYESDVGTGMKYALPLADHMFGSGKSYFGGHCISQLNLLLDYETNPYDPEDKEWNTSNVKIRELMAKHKEALTAILNAKILFIDFRYRMATLPMDHTLKLKILRLLLRDNGQQEVNIYFFKIIVLERYSAIYKL